MLYLKQSTASQALVIGPFVDDSDGVTAMTALTIDAADIRLSKNGANIVGKNSGGGTHDELGYYTITLDATDTDTVGRLQLMVSESGALPVYHEFWVLEEAIFDALFAASATGALPVSAAGLTAINAEVVDALATDTYAEPTGVPPATASLSSKIGYAYMMLRNKVTVTATKKTFYDDGDSPEFEKDLTDDGTTYTESEINSV